MVLDGAKDARFRNIPTSRNILQENAYVFAKKFGYIDFHISDDWLSEFRKDMKLFVKHYVGKQ